MNFEEIYKSYNQKVYRLCLGYTNDTDLSKDLVQDTFVQVWKNLDKFRNESSVGTWIFRIATNICLRQLERSKRKTEENIPVDREAIYEDNTDEQIKFLYKCISELPETDRLIISMVLEEVPQKEIAEILGISEGNTRIKIHRIKNALTEKFNKNERL